MTDTNFTTHGDDALEARITAWVLGEASAFEVSELERLCVERPELLVYKRRIESLHGLLAEAETSGPDSEWKLRPAKRLPIESILMGDREKRMEERIRRSSWRAITGIAACVVLTLAVAALIGNAILPKGPMLRETIAFSIFEGDHQESAGATATDAPTQKMVPFSEVMSGPLPAELIEGTPVPMREPGLVDPSDRIAGMIQGGKAKKNEKGVPQRMRNRPGSGLAGEKAASVSSAQTQASKPVAVPVQSEPTLPELVEFEGAVFADSADFGSGHAFRGSEISKSSLSGNLERADQQPAAGYRYSRQVQAGDDQWEGEGLDGTARAWMKGDGVNTRGPAVKKGAVDGGFNLGSDNDLAMAAPPTLTRGGRRGSSDSWNDHGGAKDRTRDALLEDVETTWEMRDRAKEQLDLNISGSLDEMDVDAIGQKMERKIAEVEEQVDERRKLLSTIVRTKGIIYKGEDTVHEMNESAKDSLERRDLTRVEPIKRGLDAQDYVDAKSEYKADVKSLEQLKRMQSVMKQSLEPAKLRAEKDGDEESADTKFEWKRPVAIEGEVAAAEEPYSTFSLNINDASFQVAQAALAKGEMPDPNGIQVEQFYNAVDYGDPSPRADEPVAGFIEQSAHPVIPGRNLVRIAIKTAASGRSLQQPLRLTLLTDLSGSMAREDRRAAMEEALAGLSELLQPQDMIHVIGFSRTPRLLAEGLRGDQAGKLAALMNLDANEGGTNLEEALKLAEELALRHQMNGAQNRIVLFTDGAANLGDADPESLAKRIEQLRQNGIALDIAGIAADGINDELLGEMARNGNGRYYIVGKGEKSQLAKQLAGAFRPAAENVKVQVHFNPECVSGYKLIGFEKDLLNKEDFRNDQIDAAEMAAEEAGVALYQVETLPDGEGEVGEVSVRFRDVASGQMVERTWAISHDPVAPGVRDASPSMQLAALAMMAGQKLKGGPMAGAIDLNRYAEVQASVRQHYGDGGRVGEVLQMIDALK